MKNIIYILLLSSFWQSAFSQADSSDLYYNKGLAEMEARRFLPAYNFLQEAVKYKTDNADAQMALGRSAAELRKYDVARIAFLKVLEFKKEDVYATEQVASLSFNLRKWNDAIEYAKKMQALKAGKNANYIIGKSYYELEDYGKSFQYLSTAGKEDPKNAEIPYLIGRSFVDMSNYKAAAPYLERAVTLDTLNPRHAYECALNFGAIPDDKNAIKYYLLAAQRGYPVDNDYYENLAGSYIEAGQTGEGIDLMKKLVERKPADLELLYNLGEVYYKTGKYDEAIDYMNRILGYDKGNAHALYMTGMAYQKKGDAEKGKIFCDKAIEIDPALANLRQKSSGFGL